MQYNLTKNIIYEMATDKEDSKSLPSLHSFLISLTLDHKTVIKSHSSFYKRTLQFSSDQINPLTANDKYIGHLAGAACRRCSTFHRQNHENRPRIF